MGKTFIKYVSLNIFGMIGLSCYILADTYFISARMGALGLAALNFALPAYCLLNGIGLMLGIGGGSRFSIFKAQQNPASAKNSFTQTLFAAALFALLFLVTGLFFARPVAGLLGAEGSAVGPTTTYLQTILLFSPFFLLNNIAIAFLRNDGWPKRAMAAMLIGSGANIVLDWFFMYPLGLGIFGAAFATGLSPVISLCVMLPKILRSAPLLRPVRARPSLREMFAVTALGGSAFITEFSSGVVLLVFNLVIFGLTGNQGVAAYGIIANISLVAVAVFTGIAQGVQPLASQLYGQGKSPAKLLRPALALAAALAILIYTGAQIFSAPLIAAFDSQGNPGLRALAADGVRLYFLGFLPAGINIVLAAFFSATAKARAGFTVSLLRGFVLLLPAVLLLSFSMTGVWLAFPAAESLTLLLCLPLCRQKKTQKK